MEMTNALRLWLNFIGLSCPHVHYKGQTSQDRHDIPAHRSITSQTPNSDTIPSATIAVVISSHLTVDIQA